MMEGSKIAIKDEEVAVAMDRANIVNIGHEQDNPNNNVYVSANRDHNVQSKKANKNNN